MALATHLADKSALARLSNPVVDQRLAPLILAGAVATCGIIELEVLYSARSLSDLRRTRSQRERAFEYVAMQDGDVRRAMDVMSLLAASGRHRSAGIPDLMIAAVAERAGLCVLHYDADFDAIASVTGQAVEWVVPQGSL